jgi:hypothetical protein
MAKRRVAKQGAKPLESFDKYAYYRRAVQSPDSDVEFFRDTYKAIRGALPTTLREDFCGTFSICCEWTKLGPRYIAHGVDLDHDPIQYGMNHYMPQLSKAQRERVFIHQDNVLKPELPHADIIVALNFSHYIFKERSLLKAYFENCYNTMNSDGIFICDAFGGSLCQTANEEKTKHRGYTYYWDQQSFDPVSNNGVFNIHFKIDGQKKIEKVFSYDWRMWSLPELKEIMLESGFQRAQIYWEGTTRSGEGNGVFRPAVAGEECQAWIAYVVGEK